MDWLSEDISQGVRERRFVTEAAARRIPGVLWTPAEAPRGLVLLGHGGAGHKRMAYVLAVARRLARHHGLAAAAIDGPVHGDRRANPDASDAEVFQDLRNALSDRDRVEPLIDDMVADWSHTLDALQTIDGMGDVPVGYWGLSMGTMLGLPFIARDARVRAAALGLMGTAGAVGRRLARDADEINCPVLFLVQWHDELVPRDTTLALFDRIASKHKTLHANPGRHTAVPQAEFIASETFLAQQLDVADGATPSVEQSA